MLQSCQSTLQESGRRGRSDGEGGEGGKERREGRVGERVMMRKIIHDTDFELLVLFKEIFHTRVLKKEATTTTW